MRALKPSVLNKKIRNSKFFDHFISQYGPSCTAKSSNKEIEDKLKMFYLDLAFGNLQQQKYYQYLVGDTRIVDEALQDLQNRMLEAVVYRDALKFTASINNQESFNIRSNPMYNKCVNDSENKVYAYSVLIDGLTEYKNSGLGQDGYIHPEMCNPQYLVKISIQINSNPFARGSKQQLLL